MSGGGSGTKFVFECSYNSSDIVPEMGDGLFVRVGLMFESMDGPSTVVS